MQLVQAVITIYSISSRAAVRFIESSSRARTDYPIFRLSHVNKELCKEYKGSIKIMLRFYKVCAVIISGCAYWPVHWHTRKPPQPDSLRCRFSILLVHLTPFSLFYSITALTGFSPPSRHGTGSADFFSRTRLCW